MILRQSEYQMKIVSVNIGRPKQVKWNDMIISTSIFKEPIGHQTGIKFLNIEGDVQSDLNVHGGADKAVYAYAAEHYDSWRRELHDQNMPFGMFGENLTIEGGLFEDDILVGDRFRAGSAELVAVQPRMPCYKLGIRFGDTGILKKFIQSRRYGVYFRVIAEGRIQTGDKVERLEPRPVHGITVQNIGRLLMESDRDNSILQRAAAVDTLPEKLRTHFLAMLHT
jgi:MOSC domain-containing protein YiiM